MKGLKSFIKKGQKGITLIELMVVMAILAVLASIVIPAVSGTAETSKDSQVTSDAGVVNTAVSDFFAAKVGAEIVTTRTVNILNGSEDARYPASGNASDNNAAQVISDSWPETWLTDNTSYDTEFPYDALTTVKQVTIIGDDDVTSEKDLAEKYNAIDFSKLSGYADEPASVTSKSGAYQNYLWLVKKTVVNTASGTISSRQVAVFKLTSVTTDEQATSGNNLDTLVYEKIY